jgi:hypothetical protein
MATAAYLTGRRRYQRPQAILWSENPGTLVDGIYLPTGYEVGADTGDETDESLFNQFMIYQITIEAKCNLIHKELNKDRELLMDV